MDEAGTSFNRFNNGKTKKLTVKELKAKNERLKRQYAPVTMITAEEYNRMKK